MEHKTFAAIYEDWKFGRIEGFFRSLKADLWLSNSRYKILESWLRNIPERTGRYLRYRFLSRYFQKVGKNVLIFEGIHIQGPEHLSVGSNVGIGIDCSLQCGGSLILGDDVLLGVGVKIWTVSHVFADESLPIGQQGLIMRSVEIGDDCWLCSDCFINPGTVLPKGCVVLPKAVVGRMRIPPYSVLSGNPAKVIGPRSKLGLFMGMSNHAKQ